MRAPEVWQIKLHGKTWLSFKCNILNKALGIFMETRDTFYDDDEDHNNQYLLHKRFIYFERWFQNPVNRHTR